MKEDRFLSVKCDSIISQRRLRLPSVVSVFNHNLSFLITMDDAQVVAGRPWFFPSIERGFPHKNYGVPSLVVCMCSYVYVEFCLNAIVPSKWC